MLLQMALFHSILWLSNIPLCVCVYIYIYIYIPHLLFPFFCQWTLKLLPCLGYCKQCCFILGYQSFLQINAQEWDCRIICNSVFVFKETLYCSPQWLYQCTFTSTVQEGSFISTPSPAFIIWRLFDDGQSDWCEVIPNRSFDLHFSNNQGC